MQSRARDGYRLGFLGSGLDGVLAPMKFLILRQGQSNCAAGAPVENETGRKLTIEADEADFARFLFPEVENHG